MKLNLSLSFCICILWCACNSDGSSTVDRSTVEQAKDPIGTSSSQSVFEQKCVACHGSDGTAGIANAANLLTSKIDSTSITKIIANGKGAMPSFSSQLSKEEIADLSKYLITLRK